MNTDIDWKNYVADLGLSLTTSLYPMLHHQYRGHLISSALGASRSARSCIHQCALRYSTTTTTSTTSTTAGPAMSVAVLGSFAPSVDHLIEPILTLQFGRWRHHRSIDGLVSQQVRPWSLNHTLRSVLTVGGVAPF